MPPDDLERLRVMLLDRDPGPADFYRIQLTQLATKGVIHNMPPIAQYKEIRNLIPGMRHRVERIFRFYLDGLIAHIHLPQTEPPENELWAMVLGADADVILSTVTFEASFEAENIGHVLSESLPSRLL